MVLSAGFSWGLWGQGTSSREVYPLRCEEVTPAFKGRPEPTLCDRIPADEFAIQIGAGTPYPKSSLLGATFSGNAYMVGDFDVDAPFVFLNAVVNIKQNVRITVKGSPNGLDAGNSLGIDNSKLFACDGLWKGISLEYLSTISTSNNSEIEDAETAILATGFTELYIENTTFNRNRVGIELNTPFPNTWVPGPVMWVFKENKFTCNAPLNGTTDAITQIGVKLLDADLYGFNTNSDNTFKGIANGIVAESSGSNSFAVCNVYTNKYLFEDIRSNGIDFKGRMLDVQKSRFVDIGTIGINFHESSFLTLGYNLFDIDATDNYANIRIMVSVFNPVSGTDLKITDNNFSTSGLISGLRVEGIRFISNYNAYTALFSKNIFNFQNTASGIPDAQGLGIDVLGNSSVNNSINIENNIFNQYDGNTNFNVSVLLEAGNVNVVGNIFKGGGTQINAIGSNGVYSLLDNTFNPAQNFGTGVEIFDAPKTTICSNVNNGASNVGYYFRGQNPGMVFSGNHTFGCWQHTLWIEGTHPVIGQQVHTGNQWGPAVVANGGANYFVRPFLQHSDPDPDVVDMSKFIVHTPQSVWNNSLEQYTYFSPFHPATDEIVPDMNDEFFISEFDGIPSVTCLDQLQSPDEVDVLIANGGFASRIPNKGSVFDASRYLYRKLQDDLTYQTFSPSFGAFLSAEQNTSVGKLYQLDKTIEDAHKLSSEDKTALENTVAQRESLMQEIEQPGINQSVLVSKISELSGLNQNIQEVLAQHEADKSVLLTNAMSIWQSISPQNEYEQYRKEVLGIYLIAQTQQDGILSDDQVETLQKIAALCSEEGGSAVYLAWGMLSECDRSEIMSSVEKCRGTSNVEPRNHKESGHILIREDADVQITPNPAKDWINILSVRNMEGVAQIYTLTGQLVATKVLVFGDNPLGFDLNSGVYLVRIRYENGDVSSQKLVVNN